MAVLESRATCDEEKKATVAILPGEFGAARYALWDGHGLVVRANDRPVIVAKGLAGPACQFTTLYDAPVAELLF